MAKVTLPDGSALEVAEGASVQDVAVQIGPGLAKAAPRLEREDTTCAHQVACPLR